MQKKKSVVCHIQREQIGPSQLLGYGDRRRDTVAFESHHCPLFGINDKRHPDGYLLSMAEAVYAESEGELHVV